MSAYSIAPFILRRPWLHKMVMPIANWYADAAGYRKLGLKYDDLIEEEREAVQIALKRLTPKEAYDRVFRIRRSTQLSYQHKLLPREQWTKPQEDLPYLRPLVEEVEAELAEKDAFDALHVSKKR
ncbi:hypothetical protein L249_1974 [Ophiocordyceps polyrhachis-furcata BCC 54312]|uniref:Cytochrome b-c1 complex subunit 7 n=1 Tax=Ophiocordyceps polyrhachis-furcata BCC 54312 TaxID=1330021 RepID=A0A367LNJ5_9HYPO|nr:hypothetical protein L249_1974 [Ophiocordyceps polyrhachis-furcata BCC 54312]